ncbi:dipeptidase [Cohaesibacter intestini]|uniref:dipeptidase n=1 Tax=Cohaesibacter intestini TaxID=2211145 RepID=UPI000DEB5A71|nr:dipeptidase [Cohaesibacter intestini]
MADRLIPVFDGHNDTLLQLTEAERKGAPISFMDGDESLHIDWHKAGAGAFAGGFFAMFVPPVKEGDQALELHEMLAPVEQTYALDYTMHLASSAFRLEKESGGSVRICRSAADIRKAMSDGVIAMLLHIEGAEAIDPDFHALEVLYGAGLRSIGPVWSRANIFATGVPFDFPGSPDQGPGLTDKGRELVRRCNQMGIMLDLSHLNEAGFWDIQKLSSAPLVATHSNVHALSHTPRNLTDKQLDAIAESKGVVGLNYAVGFLREDGDQKNAHTPIERMLTHLDYLLAKLGEDGVALGSDFDGCTVPEAIGSSAGNPKLIDAMRSHGFGEALIEKIAHGNWISLLERSGI